VANAVAFAWSRELRKGVKPGSSLGLTLGLTQGLTPFLFMLLGELVEHARTEELFLNPGIRRPRSTSKAVTDELYLSMP